MDEYIKTIEEAQKLIRAYKSASNAITTLAKAAVDATSKDEDDKFRLGFACGLAAAELAIIAADMGSEDPATDAMRAMRKIKGVR